MKPEDAGRRFIISYRLADDMMIILFYYYFKGINEA